MLDPIARRLIDPWLARLARPLVERGIDATTVTVAGFALGLAGALAISSAWWLLGLGLLLINRLADGLDGAIARARGATDLGGYLDIVLDFIVYAALVVAFAVADPTANGLPAVFLLWAFMGTGSSFLAFAIMAEKRGITTQSRGQKSLYYLGGLTEGSETILFFVLCCLIPGLFPVLATVFAGLCWLTTLGRVLTARQLLR